MFGSEENGLQVIHFEKYIGDWFDYLLVSKKEMKDILKDTGWTAKKFINYEKGKYIAIIKKDLK